MKIVINKTFGGFSVPDVMQEELGCHMLDDSVPVRVDPRFIEWVEKHQDNYNCDLGVVDIPDEATDWMIDDYDGRENIIAVVDGKLVKIYA